MDVGRPVLAVAHDAEGDLQLSCGAGGHTRADWRLSRLVATELLPLDLPPLTAGTAALRLAADGAWRVVRLD